MRFPDSPMTAEEFDDALADARRGVLGTDQGATDAILDALTAVALDPSAVNVAAARAAFDLPD